MFACHPVANDSLIQHMQVRLNGPVLVESPGSAWTGVFVLLVSIQYRPCMNLMISIARGSGFELRVIQPQQPKAQLPGESYYYSMMLLQGLSLSLVCLVFLQYILG